VAKMANYKQMTLTYLEQNNPQELTRLKTENELTEFLNLMEEQYEDQEQTIIRQMSENLPDEYLERVRSLEQAKMVAEETTTQYLTEFLASL
jgi:hypothetical protein